MKLFPHQEDALKATEGQNRVAYYLDMGLGKTFVGSEKTMQLGSNVNLVICQKSKIDDWVEHFNEHYEVIVLNLTNKRSLECFLEWSSKWIEFEKPLIGIVNYQTAWRRKDLLQLQNFTLMLDESSLIQNRKAKQSKFILSLNPSNVILLSGTPTSGKYENLWTQIHLLGWDISEDVYNRQYVNWVRKNFGGFVHKIVDKKNPYKNVDRLKSKLREHGGVFMKTEDVFDLPEQTFITINVPVIKEYKKFKKDCIVTIDDVELIGDTTLTKMLYMRMLCGQYNKEKLEAFKDLVESTQDRLIVFYNFKEELKQLKKIAEELERPVSEVNGQIKDLDAYETEDDSITFVQFQAGSMGLNLQKANKIIYFTLTQSCENWMQSQKRTHRLGQERPCFYYLLICKNSIEEDIMKALESGVDFTNCLFEEGEKNER